MFNLIYVFITFVEDLGSKFDVLSEAILLEFFPIRSLWAEHMLYHDKSVFIIYYIVKFSNLLLKMAKLGGLQMVKPSFDWESKDKLTELEQFKANCNILFNGPICDLKEKQRVGLLVNCLGREATQILNSVDAQIDNTNEVFEALERVFRPESNQTLAHFKFRNMKQKASQTCDAYMSELRLALPECKYRNDADELFKDQFIFGICNKEIQDHLLGEIKETDNSVRSLYEARKIELKLAQRQMLGIVNPSTLVSVEAVKRGFKCDHRNSNDEHRDLKCDYCRWSHRR